MAYALQSRLNSAISNVFRRCQHLGRYTSSVQPECRFFATRKDLDDEEDFRPAKYTTSRANFETAEAARKKEMGDDRPISQTLSLWLSLFVFLAYFGYFREENDLDRLIEKDLYETVPGLKESHEKMTTRAGRDAAWKEMERSL